MIPLVAVALKLAPFIAPHLMRALSSDKNQTAATAADAVIRIAQTVTGITDPAGAAAAIADNHAFQLEMRKQSAAVTIAEIQETNATARVEAQSVDEYVRRTRPMLARRAFVAGVWYVVVTGLLFPLLNAKYGIKLPGPSEWILAALFAPLLTYIGARTADKFSQYQRG
jgi:hypothetical protein